MSIKGDRKATSRLGPEATWHGPSDTTSLGHNKGIVKGATVFGGCKDMALRPLANWKQEGGRRGSGFCPQDHGSDEHTMAQSKYEGGGPQAIWATRALIHSGDYEDNLGHKGPYSLWGLRGHCPRPSAIAKQQGFRIRLLPGRGLGVGLEPQSRGQFGHKGIQDQAPIRDIGKMPLGQLGQKSHKKEGIWAKGRLLPTKGSEMGLAALGRPIRARGDMAWANCQSNFGPPLGHSPWSRKLDPKPNPKPNPKP